jgi:ABC-type thiamine transport system substrate-binding protein
VKAVLEGMSNAAATLENDLAPSKKVKTLTQKFISFMSTQKQQQHMPHTMTYT